MDQMNALTVHARAAFWEDVGCAWFGVVDGLDLDPTDRLIYLLRRMMYSI